MESTGVMQEIRKLLSQDKSSGEVMAMGYAPGSVYKAQRQLRGKGKLNEEMAQSQSGHDEMKKSEESPATSQGQEEKGLTPWELWWQGKWKPEQSNETPRPQEGVEDTTSIRSQLDQLQQKLEDLTREAGQFKSDLSQSLQAQTARTDALESKVAGLASEFQQACRDLT